MGLENLRSIFADINTDVDTREDGTNFESLVSGHTLSDFNFGTTIPAVDFISSNIPGFTLNFDTPGHTWGDGDLGDSKFIFTSPDPGVTTLYNVSSQFDFSGIPPSVDFIDSPVSGFDIFFNSMGTGMGTSKFLDVESKYQSASSDIRFQSGIGFPASNFKLSHPK